MPSDAYPEGTVDPQATVEEFLHWVLSTSIHCVIAVALGMLAARLMRSRHLHWSWAAVALAVLILIRLALGSTSSTLALAALVAAARGRRWHREDVHAGADLAEIAARRSHPLDGLRSLVQAAAERARERRGVERRRRDGQLALGREESGRTVSIPFADGGGGTHTLVVGATGSGKTVTQTWIALRAIQQGMGAIVVDPKGDDKLREQVHRAAMLAGRRFIEWTPDGGSVYNPFARGAASEIADKALAGERFTEPHYLRQAQRYLGHVVRGLRESGSEVSLRAIVEHLEPARLELLARSLPETSGGAVFSYLDSLSSRQQSELAGVRDRLAILTESDVGLWLDPLTAGAAQFDLLTAVRQRAVVYFGLQSDSRPLLSQMLGAAIVQDLQTVVASLQSAPIPTLVVIDEFSAVAAEQVVRLFGRARSAGLSLLLGTQELSDLRLPGREHLLEQVLGNLSVLIAHRQVVPDSAELIASVAGTQGAWRVSQHSDGRSTRVRTRTQVLDADRVMSLGSGWAAVLVLGRGSSARIARIFAPAQRH
ncbi:MAG TPA: type IV secretion system DNA-binding domain-containing protein [Solirubrobacteraceae bacterium]|jgi:type IV secretory pathway TraG/TraD family ATPase VirD4|nr:type IV secretion system DNA-binding domain-containing protein [Solirubrobacteraceae bacterium]